MQLSASKQISIFPKMSNYSFKPSHLCCPFPLLQEGLLLLHREEFHEELAQLGRVRFRVPFPIQFGKIKNFPGTSAESYFTGTSTTSPSINQSILLWAWIMFLLHLSFVLPVTSVHLGGRRCTQYCRFEPGGEQHSEYFLLAGQNQHSTGYGKYTHTHKLIHTHRHTL